MRRLLRMIMLVALLLPACLVLSATESVAIRISPRTGNVPHTFNVVLTVQKDARTREVCLMWRKEGEDFGSISCRDEEGERAPMIYQYQRTIRESGTWLFRGVVRRSDSIQRSVEIPVIVIGGI